MDPAAPPQENMDVAVDAPQHQRRQDMQEEDWQFVGLASGRASPASSRGSFEVASSEAGDAPEPAAAAAPAAGDADMAAAEQDAPPAAPADAQGPVEEEEEDILDIDAAAAADSAEVAAAVEAAAAASAQAQACGGDAGHAEEVLADAVLGQPVMEAAAAVEEELVLVVESEEEAASLAPSEEGPEGLQALRSLSGLSQEGSLHGYAPSISSMGSQQGDDAEDAEAGVLARLCTMFADLQAQVVAAAANAGAWARQELAAIGAWASESTAALSQGMRAGGDAVGAALQSSLGQLLALLPRRSSYKAQGLDAPVAWGMLGLAATCVITAAAAVFAFYKNFKLTRDLRSRDRELSKLVMRVVSLQEVLHQHRHVPITRYTSYGFSHTCL